ncbi:hypothetical protein [uncultured Ferrimonas sp.]|uniref:hypothetical protein n=1 Tax=uncultured Ferrimonas sp. TaxID=432640 RepID=UPI002604D5FF|nr:hypothetical protein [uncultured Ferrimonas sp.]
MKMFSQMRVALTALVAIALLSGCSVTSVRMHEDHAQHTQDYQRIAIVPPVVEMKLVNFDGEGERLTPQEDAIRSQLIAEASSKLTARGFTPVVVERERMLAQFADFNVDVANLRESYQSIAANLYTGKAVNEKKVASFRQSVGEAASVVAHSTNSDAILLLKYTGWEKSKGSVAKDMAASILVGVLTAGAVVPVQAMSGESVEAALIDGDSGDVVWANVFAGADNSGGAVSANLTELQRLQTEAQPVAEIAETEAKKKL